MRPKGAGFTGDAALVAGELRGYRHFQLQPDGLYPVALVTMGPWDGGTAHAACADDAGHPAPGRSCGCGLYGWYHPGDAAGRHRETAAVIAARGRTILGDKGFRTAAARIVAVTLPLPLRLRPAAAARARRMLAARYPHTRVYESRRRMLRDHPPEATHALGIRPCRNVGRICARIAAVLRVLFLAVAYGVILLPPNALPVSARRAVFLAALLLVSTAHILLALVALISRRGSAVARRTYGHGRAART
ncbi:MAG: hypothetical protein ACXV5Q_08260 [Frankiaceae bacterium]